MSCTGPHFCAAIGNNVSLGATVEWSEDPAAGAWQAELLHTFNFLSGISCPTEQLCVIGGGPAVYSTGDVAGGIWSIVPVPGPTEDMTCPALALCLSSGGGSFVTTTAPGLGLDHWSVQTGPTDLGTIVGCPSTNECIAYGGAGHMLVGSNDPGKTTTTMSASTPLAATGTPVTYTATVEPKPVGGTVTITGCAPVEVINGEAVCTKTYASAGTRSVSATFSGTDQYDPSTSQSITVSVPWATLTTLTASQTTVVFGQQVILTATITPVPDGGTASVGPCAQVKVVKGEARCKIGFGPGIWHETASYSGNENYAPSTSMAVTITGSRASTKTTVASSTANAAPGSEVTLTATVSVKPPGTAEVAPAGTVEFRANGTDLGSCLAVPLNRALPDQAACTTTFASAGEYEIMAVYSGNPLFEPSLSRATRVSIR